VRDATPTLAGYTTLRLGGPADRLVEATDEHEVIGVATGPLFVLAGGSNVVIGDEGIRGPVLLLRTSGVHPRRDGDHVVVRVAAGEPWDGVVARALAESWSGLECLSGIPGSAGATPIQNVGAYGREVAETITSVRALDRRTGEVVTYSPTGCDFRYRTSVFKYSDRWIVLSVDFRLERSGRSAPIRYPELAAALGVPVGARADAAEVRDAVLKLRAGKGMVLDPDDPDTYSVGSFFTNPVLDPAEFAALAARAGAAGEPPAWPAADGTVKTSAAWLIEKAGFAKGYGRDGVAISSKHTLALTNRGTGTTAALLDLAREIRAGVRDRFGITLHPEPVLVGCAL
jgi:UDP-N-acetylmuramate dehydrogenase